jgi:hypothetical protein
MAKKWELFSVVMDVGFGTDLGTTLALTSGERSKHLTRH